MALLALAILSGAGLLNLLAALPQMLFSPAVASFPFPCLRSEGEQQHIHSYLRIIVRGRPVEIPAFIGIRRRPDGTDCLEPVHTHDASGIIHIESHSPTEVYILADFFAIWRATYPMVRIAGAQYPVTYSDTELLGHKGDARHPVRLLVEGKLAPQGPGLILNTLNYCNAKMIEPPCAPTAVGDPFPPFLVRRYGTGHTIVLEYP